MNEVTYNGKNITASTQTSYHKDIDSPVRLASNAKRYKIHAESLTSVPVTYALTHMQWAHAHALNYKTQRPGLAAPLRGTATRPATSL